MKTMMKKVLSCAALVGSTVVFGAFTSKDDNSGTYIVDNSQTTIEWVGKK